MSSNMTLSILGLYNYDNTIFDDLSVPEGMNKETLVNNILTECAEFEILYPNSDFMKSAIGTWSTKEFDTWQKLYDVWASDFDISNEFDYTRTRTPNISKTKTGTETDTPTGSIIDSGTVGSTTTDSVSAYNSSSFENREQSVVNGTNGNTRSFNNYQNQTSYNTTDRETGSETITEKGHKTPVYELIKQASSMAVNNIYDFITESFKDRFCLLIY